MSIPEEFICPITKEVMKDPVMGPDGHTYERVEIEEWLREHGFSPMTRKPMSRDQLVKNHALRNAIERYLQAGDTGGAPAVPTTASSEPIAPILPPVVVTIDSAVAAKNYAADKNLARITITPPVDGDRIETVVIAMLDVSGSMGMEASLAKDRGEPQSFSRLDLVKHSMKTIKELLNGDDQLSIITFSDRAEMCLPLTKMDTQGKRLADERIDYLQPDASTNVWDALRLGIETARKPSCRDKNVVLLLLTDGEPNINPPRGLARTVSDTIKGLKKEAERFTIHTFGFGYKLDSLLLDEISSIGRGTYAYIPDCTMVGTVFINFMASTLSTVIPNVNLRVEGVDVLKAFGNLTLHKSTEGITIPLGSIQYGQSRTVLLEIKEADISNLKLDLEWVSKNEVIVNQLLPSFSVTRDQQIVESYAVGILIDILLDITKQKFSTAFKGKIHPVVKEIESLPSTPFLEALQKDIHSHSEKEGQIFKAITSEDWYTRWGRDHLLSFVKAHTLQRCSNFKDCSLQDYGGEMFKKVQDEANKIFCSLPPPVPSCDGSGTTTVMRVPHRPATQPKYHTHTVTAPPNNDDDDRIYDDVYDMSPYLNAHGGCFDGDGLIWLANGQTKPIRLLQQGDRLISDDGAIATVQAVIETVISVGQQIEVVELNGLYLTPWHPVLVNNTWVFPAQVGTTKKVSLSSIYNLVLDVGHIVKINSLEVITLGHGRTEGVLAHPYFGTSKVIDDLKKHPDWSSGHVVIVDPKTVRDENGLVCKFY